MVQTKKRAAHAERSKVRTPRTSVRRWGAYYTPEFAARSLVQWAIRSSDDVVLEPSMGDGVFLRAIKDHLEDAPSLAPTVKGIEVHRTAFRETVSAALISEENAICADFLSVAPFRASAVVGNPPYVRLRNLPEGPRQQALKSAHQFLGVPMDPSGSVWMPFVLHAMSFLQPGGRLAFVLPYELTHVRYAHPLWRALGEHFGSLRVTRARERLFPQILQETVLLFADDYGGSTPTVDFVVFDGRDDFLNDQPTSEAVVEIASILSGSKPFLEALLSRDLRRLLDRRILLGTVPAREVADFRIGYVAGDKGFFHPSKEIGAEYQIPRRHLRPALASGRALTGAGIRTSNCNEDATTCLFYPPASAQDHSPGDREYIRLGEESGIANRYKCRVRKPWYVVPGVRIPDVLLPVFSDRPAMLINDRGYVASNSLLCGYLHGGPPEAIALAWFTSLTLLQLELNVHSLGGGVLVLVPREVGEIRLPRPSSSIQRAALARVDRALAAGHANEAFQMNDHQILGHQLQLEDDEIELLSSGVRELSEWRRSAASSPKPA